MIARRSLRITKIVALGNEAASGPFLNALLRAHVLAEWTTKTGVSRSEFITFPHHLLFDYAGARLYLPPEPDDLVDLLSGSNASRRTCIVLADWLQSCGVDTVAMQSTCVFQGM